MRPRLKGSLDTARVAPKLACRFAENADGRNKSGVIRASRIPPSIRNRLLGGKSLMCLSAALSASCAVSC